MSKRTPRQTKREVARASAGAASVSPAVLAAAPLARLSAPVVGVVTFDHPNGTCCDVQINCRDALAALELVPRLRRLDVLLQYGGGPSVNLHVHSERDLDRVWDVLEAANAEAGAT